ncbi:MAG: 16S rRNA (cytosine(967)-C(5))-methyltransferase RsmB [Terriglobales bacterium]
MPASPARQAADAWLAAVEERSAYLSELLRGPRARQLSPPDRRLAQEIAFGVLRHRGELDYRIGRAARRPVEKIAPAALRALRIGMYQLHFLSRVPEVAAVHESVELAKAAGTKTAGFVNAVLRNDLREQPRPALAALLAREDDPMTRRAIETSHPAWLLARWEARWGSEALRRVCAFDNRAPAAALRLRPGLPVAAATHALASEGIVTVPGELLPQALRVTQGDAAHSALAAAGDIAIQDEASQLLPLLLEPAGRSAILDCCAAPGGKTAILRAEAPWARLVAVELHPHRARALRRRLGPEAIVVVADATRPLPLEQRFDAVLVDAPCTGTGTLQRHPEIRWRLRPEDPARLGRYQAAILDCAIAALAPGGVLLYAVCSLEREEGEDVVQAALARHRELRLAPLGPALERLTAAGRLRAQAAELATAEGYFRILPGEFQTEGFFAARLSWA